MSLEAIKSSVDTLTNTTTAELRRASARMDAIEAVMKRPGFGVAANDNESALQAERNAIGVFARTGDDSRLKEIHAGMSVGSDPDGGLFVLPTYSSTMTKKLHDALPMRQIARIEQITSGDSFVEPIDNGEVEAVWVGERSERPATQSPKMGELKVPAHEIYSNTPITQKLIDDAGFDIGGYVEGKAVDQFSRAESSAFISGNGVSRPRGLLTYEITATADATRPWAELQYVPSGGATTVTADGLKNLYWTLRTPYRKDAVWLINSNTANAIDKLKNPTTGDYLWRDSMSAGAPPTLLGHPVHFDENLPNIGAGALPIAFGNFKLGYVIVDRLGVRFLRDPYSDKPNTQFYSYKRVGGGVANSQALKFLKVQES